MFWYSIALLAFCMTARADQFADDVLDAHNTYRASHGVPAVQLDETLSAYAQDWAQYMADNDNFEERPDNQYGENIYATTDPNVGGSDPVYSWYDEINEYDFYYPGLNANTRHFTQLVWKSSTLIGVGKATGASGWTYVVVDYDPPGNVVGEFPTNVMPPL